MNRGVSISILLATTIVMVTACDLVGGDESTSTSETTQALTSGKHPPCAPNVASCVDMHIVAHEDDDVAFMNPDIATSIANGNHVVTVFLTAGSNPNDDGQDMYAGTLYASSYDPHLGGYNSSSPTLSASDNGQEHFIDRELGALNAYSFMAGSEYAAICDPVHCADSLANADTMLAHWRLSTPIFDTHMVAQYDFVGDPSISITLVFLRMYQEGGGGPSGDLSKLWNNTGAVMTFGCDEQETSGQIVESRCPFGAPIPPASKTILTSDHQTFHTSEELVVLLADLMNKFQSDIPGSQLLLSTQDSTFLYMYEKEGCPAPGWDCITDEYDWVDNPDHVWAANFAISAFHRYHQYSNTAPRALREYRDYDFLKEPTNLGSKQVLAKLQVLYRNFIMRGVTNDSNADPDNPGFSFSYEDFAARQYSVITLASANTLQGRLMNMSGKQQCLRYDKGILQMGMCGDAPEWQLTTRNEIRLGSDLKSCIQLDTKNKAFLGPCLPTKTSEAQTLVVTSNGQIRSRNAGCLSGAGTSVVAVPCTGSYYGGNPLRIPPPTENWTLLFSDPVLDRSGQFSDSSGVGNYRSYYRTITIADGQICLRNQLGVGCSQYLGGTLQPFAYWSQSSPPEYADSTGWLGDSTGSTISFRHLSVSGGLSVCGRGAYGMRCGLPHIANWWTTEFSDYDGWASNSTYYGSLRLADINGDGNADVCGRSEFGVRCLTGTGSSFTNDAIWTSEYGSGWSFGQYGETLQFGDVDGDGRDDVCGRGSYGMSCSVSDPSTSSFVDIHNWSMNVNNDQTADSADFGDSDPIGAWNTTAGRYRGIRLVDINRDGLVDVCGHGASGIYCALSTGTAFEMKRNVMPFNFGGTLWDNEQYGSTITFGNLDGDARVDMCLRGIYGMMCSKGP